MTFSRHLHLPALAAAEEVVDLLDRDGELTADENISMALSQTKAHLVSLSSVNPANSSRQMTGELTRLQLLQDAGLVVLGESHPLQRSVSALLQ